MKSHYNDVLLCSLCVISAVASDFRTIKSSTRPCNIHKSWSLHNDLLSCFRGGGITSDPNGVRGGMVATKKRKNVFGRFGRKNNLDKTFIGATTSNNNGTSSFDFSLETVESLPPAVTTPETTPLVQEGHVMVSRSDDEYKRALTKTILTVSAAAMFGVGLMATRGTTSGYEFFAGYLIEQSLSIDNLFVFIMLFEYFKVPMELQNRVLSWGIGGAIALRGLMIGVGVAALQKFKSVILVFAGILIASSINLLMEKEEKGSDHQGENVMMKLTKFLFPNTSSELHGENFFVTNEQGKRLATPLFLCLVCVELSDFVFAVDSIPAVLGVSKDPLIVYTSNIFAIMALRSLYTVVAKAVSTFHYLKPAVALVLGFVGSKMIAEYFHVEIGTGASLAVICSLLSSGVLASVAKNQGLLQTEKGTTRPE